MLLPRPLVAGLCAAAVAPVLALLPPATPVSAAPDATGLAAAPARPAARAAAVLPSALGHDRIAVRRSDTWLLRDSLSGTAGSAVRTLREEAGGWQPVAGDTDGDGTGSLSLFRDGVWRLRESEGGPVRVVRFGRRGDVPLLGDWDGDGTATLGLFRTGRWFLRASNAGRSPSRTFGFGVGGDRPVVGDWDADGDTDLAVTRGSRWYQRDAASGGPSSRSFLFGQPGDLPLAGDWDHDGRDTPGLFRRGTWYFKVGNGFGGYQSTAFGRAGDRPVVRRTPGLAPGAAHRVLRDGASTVHVATVDLAAASSPDAVLSGDDLRGLETTSSMGRRTGAALAINADYFLGSGRPVHAMAADGQLLQTPQLLGRAFSLDGTGTQVRMGFPDVRLVLTPPASTPTTVTRWNTGGTSGDAVVGYTDVAAGLDEPEPDRCYLGGTFGDRTVRPDGGVESALTVSGTRCFGPAPVLGPAGSPTETVLATEPLTSGETLFRSLGTGSALPTTAHLGFPGAVDLLGGNPLLLRDGAPQSQDHVGAGAFFARQPRTAVGVTSDGRLLLVVVDGRQGGYSAGMTLVELADLLARLGARDAINLDGGGSSTMYVNGLVANRPSDAGRERGVANALVVLPGADPGQARLTVGAPRTANVRPRLQAARRPAGAPTALVDERAGFAAAAQDPGSVGGLADALEADGVRLPADLRQADALYDRTR